ncbi:MAG: hypothetical protein J6Y10_02985 [Lachnospiraceae bacterium]|nr:hypothetical protein [Lachnospiraceae bacterium]
MGRIACLFGKHTWITDRQCTCRYCNVTNHVLDKDCRCAYCGQTFHEWAYKSSYRTEPEYSYESGNQFLLGGGEEIVTYQCKKCGAEKEENKGFVPDCL